MEPTIADGTAGGIEPGSITFEICQETIDDFILVSENEIRAAMRHMIQQHQILIEGAAALSVAYLLKEKSVFIIPGDCFGMDHYLRIGIGGEKEHLLAGLDLIDEMLHDI